MFDYTTIQNQIIDYLGERVTEYDIDSIIEEIRDIEPDVQGIDDIEQDDFIDIIMRHDKANDTVTEYDLIYG